MAILIFFLLVLIPYAASISFNFTNFSSNSPDIILSGGASISAGEIQLTSENRSYDPSSLAGRATYIQPLQLWKNDTIRHTSQLASFSTNFSFVMDSQGSANHSDGLTFFLAQNNSVISGGAAMGLPFNTTSNISITPFVAVELDTYSNEDWDYASVGDHVGINVNSLTSVRYQQWLTDLPNGREYQAWIQYNGTSNNLSVSFTGFQNNTVVRENGLYYSVDLRDVLPDSVIFGFSASGSFEKYNIKSWMFNSSDFDVRRGQEPPNFTGILVGLAIGLVTMWATAAFILWRKRKTDQDEDEDPEFFLDAAGPRRFSYAELASSTATFAEEGKLGQGGFGEVYKGFLKDLHVSQ